MLSDLEGQPLGNYDVIRRIRVGGMGAVYEGRQRTAFDRRVAIKVILGDYAADREMRRRFMREARTIARLHHPHILPLIEFGEERGEHGDDNILFLVMPFIEGGTLTSYLRHDLPDLGEIAAIYQQLLDAVEYAHDEGLIHRDIKSSNVLMEPRRTGPPYVYLADFGLVRTTRPKFSGGPANTGDSGSISRIGKPIPLDQVPGTPHYMAPEQTRGIVTPLTDIYALGVLLYQMLTGELPYNDPDDVRVIQMHLHDPIPAPSDRDPSIPPKLDEVVRTAMAKRPDARYRNVAALRAAFLAALNGPVPMVAEDEAPDIYSTPTVPPASVETSLPPAPRRAPVEQPEPIIMPRRPYEESTAVVMRAGKVRPRTTETFKQSSKLVKQVKPRITEEPAAKSTINRPTKKRSMTGFAWVMISMVVTFLLLIGLILARVVGISILPASIPLLGGSPVATIYVVPQSKMLQGSYVLTASPNVKIADLNARTIPDRPLQYSVSASKTVSTTGTRSDGAVQAQGIIEFNNNNNSSVFIAAQTIISSSGGMQVRVTQDVHVPSSNHNGGRANAPAVALTAGAAGNIPAHALDGPCCTNGLTISNPAPFSGGSDGQTVHIVTQADRDAAQQALTSSLEQQALHHLQTQLHSDEAIAGTPAYTVTADTNHDVGDQSDTLDVHVTVISRAAAYSNTVLNQTASQLLGMEAARTLGRAYQAHGVPNLVGSPAVQQGQNGVIYLNTTIRGSWSYSVTPQQISQWQQSIKGATSAAARAYLSQQPGIDNVQIQLPFGTDHLPTSTDQIKIVVNTN